MWLSNIIHVAYSIPCLIAYFIAIYIVSKLHKELSVPFVALFYTSSAANLSTYFLRWIKYNLQIEPAFFAMYAWIAQFSILVNILQFLEGWTAYFQHGCAFLFSANRFTAVALPHRHARFWNSYCGWVIIAMLAVTTAITFPFTLANPPHKLWWDNNTVPDVPQWVFSLGPYVPYVTWTLYILPGYALVMFLVCSTANIVSLMKLIQMRFSNNSTRKETYFFVISFCTFLAQSLYLLQTLVIYWVLFAGDYAALSAVVQITPFTSDFFSLSLPIYTLLIPSIIRERFLQSTIGSKIGPKRNRVNAPSTTASSTASMKVR